MTGLCDNGCIGVVSQPVLSTSALDVHHNEAAWKQEDQSGSSSDSQSSIVQGPYRSVSSLSTRPDSISRPDSALSAVSLPAAFQSGYSAVPHFQDNMKPLWKEQQHPTWGSQTPAYGQPWSYTPLQPGGAKMGQPNWPHLRQSPTGQQSVWAHQSMENPPTEHGMWHQPAKQETSSGWGQPNIPVLPHKSENTKNTNKQPENVSKLPNIQPPWKTSKPSEPPQPTMLKITPQQQQQPWVKNTKKQQPSWTTDQLTKKQVSWVGDNQSNDYQQQPPQILGNKSLEKESGENDHHIQNHQLPWLKDTPNFNQGNRPSFRQHQQHKQQEPAWMNKNQKEQEQPSWLKKNDANIEKTPSWVKQSQESDHLQRPSQVKLQQPSTPSWMKERLIGMQGKQQQQSRWEQEQEPGQELFNRPSSQQNWHQNKAEPYQRPSSVQSGQTWSQANSRAWSRGQQPWRPDG